MKTSAPGYSNTPVRSWYDFHDGECQSPDDKPDIDTLKATCSEIHKIIKAEQEIVGDPCKVFVGGVSQGCCAAFHAVSTYPGIIGGFYGSIGHIMPCTDVYDIENKVSGPIIFYSGANDDVMSWKWVKNTFARLKYVPRVEIWREDGVEHEDDGHWIANFLCRVLPPPTVTEQLDAYDFNDSLLSSP
jgi:predicted esterase